MNYDDLFKMVKEMNQVKGEKCMICHFPDTNQNLLKLKCGHFFHKKCLALPSSGYIKCPYCEQTCIMKEDNNIPSVKCKVILKSGVNKGKECGRINCKYHKQVNVCQEILKSGIRKGEICGRINCKYHKVNTINISV